MDLLVSLPPFDLFSGQVKQYPEHGPKGISYFAGVMDVGTVDCLLYRDKSGKVRGILNHYPFDYPPLEKAGNITIWIEQRFQRRGIGTRLLAEAERRWRIDWERQQYSEAGALLTQKYLESKSFPPLERSKLTDEGFTVEQVMHGKNMTQEQAERYIREAREEIEKAETYVNPIYQVQRRDDGTQVYLSVKRRDRDPVFSWSDLQAIKNQLVGPECEGVELFPAESRLVDEANQTHLWVLKDATKRMPYIYERAPDDSGEAFTVDGYDVVRYFVDDLVYLTVAPREEGLRDWRDLQHIKNTLVGVDCEGLNVFPAESRRIDDGLLRLWVVRDPTVRLPVGFHGERKVSYEPWGPYKQRPARVAVDGL